MLPLFMNAQTFDFDMTKPQPRYDSQNGYGYDILPSPDKKKPSLPSTCCGSASMSLRFLPSASSCRFRSCWDRRTTRSASPQSWFPGGISTRS